MADLALKKPANEESSSDDDGEQKFDFIKACAANNFGKFLQAAQRPNLPEPVKKRVKALKKVQLECIKLEAEFQKELYALEVKFHEKNQANFEKRAAIVTGKYEPTEEECDFPEEEIDQELEQKLKIEDVTEGEDELMKMDDNAKGIPGFWLQILRTNTVVSDQIQEHDWKVLKHLEDLKVKHKEGEMGFTLEFHFAPNEFFTNSVLTKHYDMKVEIDKDHPLSFSGAEICNCTGCTIDWKPGQDVTHKQITKKQKNKNTGVARTVTKTVEVESFFQFFTPPIVPEDPAADVADEIKSDLLNDFQIGQYLRDHVVPNAVLYYTGERDDDDDEDDYEEEEDEDEDGEEEEEVTQKRPSRNKKAPAGGLPECQQQ